MALRDDIFALRDGVWEGVVGHRTDHATVHAGMKSHETRLATLEGRKNITWLYYGTDTPALGDFPGIKIGDRILRVSDDQVWRVDE